ncbi:MAG TPA: hypothetical protein VKA87_10440 [Nitrososphaeraceae archaeon]|nr:hypothetical protein [Nitrososphaeraceae archaeon]
MSLSNGITEVAGSNHPTLSISTIGVKLGDDRIVVMFGERVE